ncbi:hypothetical protein M9H77_01822 [Catharanthus roseus]|uniref:Uncharacterized protein n=1 Tax=Catharanthus roseus TaxID=4058 RepID=A0ACC0C6S3_CATRO|nr:hypothetical protein M9H77_01822 [Catharanthus roseus]
MFGAARQDSSCSTYGYSHADYGVSSSDHYVPGPADRVPEGDRGESDERGDDDGGDGDGEGGDGDGDGDDDDHDDDDDGDEEQPVYVAPVAPASGSDGRPRHGKGKGLTGSLMLVMKAAEGGPVYPELIPSYGGHVAGGIWREQDRGLLKCRSRYMALTGWELTDSQAGPLLILGVPAYGAVVDHKLSRDQLIRAVQQDLSLGLAGGLGFNALELQAVATSR